VDLKGKKLYIAGY